MTRRARYRIEVKSRLEEDLYAGLQAYKTLNNTGTDSETVARILRLFLFGTVGTLPASLVDVSSKLGQEGITVTI
jgi:hypothetical protein